MSALTVRSHKKVTIFIMSRLQFLALLAPLALLLVESSNLQPKIELSPQSLKTSSTIQQAYSINNANIDLI